MIATLKDGAITELHATDASAAPAADILRAMGAVDSRYLSLLEIGFGITTGLELFRGNSAMNEVFGGVDGAVHFGFGIMPDTQDHLDLISPHTKVLDARGDLVVGGPGR